ncbi:MAG: GntR family transcriptional regulator [Chloroflexota bacterium]|nr:MAG: GntR family transcriptional regulator [Chloroflexota bacterium]
MVTVQELPTSFAFSIPLYVQIANRLISQIETGDLSPGEQLPAEREFSENIGVNRMTLRRALQVLESQGLIVRKHGVGTFIAEPKIDRQVEVIYRFTSVMQNRGLTPGAKIISLERIPAGRFLARNLAIDPGDEVFDILRLRSINEEPVMLENYKISVARFPQLDHYDLENHSIYEIMENEYAVPIQRARQSFEPIVASEFEASILEINIGEALMLETRISYDARDIPVEFGKDRYRGDRFRFLSETTPFNF